MPFEEENYKAIVQEVIPNPKKVSWNQFDQFDKCYLGISLGTTYFREEKLRATLEWIDKHFSTCLLLVGDSIYRLTLCVANGINEMEASIEAKIAGEEFSAYVKSFLEELTSCRFVIIKSTVISQTNEYLNYFEQLLCLYQSDNNFRLSILKSANDFVDRKNFIGNMKLAYEQAIRLSAQYILEEIAIFACLVEKGWQVEVYPGKELPVLIEIANGLHQGVPSILRERINIALKLKKVKSMKRMVGCGT